MVIRKLIEIIGLSIELVICATKRESDGLAMSSRNVRLDETARRKAPKLFETINFIKKEIKAGFVHDLSIRASDYLTAEGFRVDYVSIADAFNLEEVLVWDGKQSLVILVAAFWEEVRLIDNISINH
jgi:pantoate--beta-alanine ligase